MTKVADGVLAEAKRLAEAQAYMRDKLGASGLTMQLSGVYHGLNIAGPINIPAPQTEKNIKAKGDVIQNITINSPTPLSPFEIARQNLKVARELGMMRGL